LIKTAPWQQEYFCEKPTVQFSNKNISISRHVTHQLSTEQPEILLCSKFSQA